jgi:prophage antirepressor-like protein
LFGHNPNLFQKCVSYHQTTSLASSFSYSAVSVFNFENHHVRTVVDDNGRLWFVANDVALALGYKKPNNAIHAHCEMDASKQGMLQTSGGMQKAILIDESNVFKLIFGSKLESSKRFTKWVTSEVLPTIRKTGKYEVPITTPAHFTVVIRGKFSVKPLSTLNFLLWKVWKFKGCDL